MDASLRWHDGIGGLASRIASPCSPRGARGLRPIAGSKAFPRVTPAPEPGSRFFLFFLFQRRCEMIDASWPD